MRIATYNVENLFDRAKVMNQKTWAEGREVLNDFAALNRLLGKLTYTTADKAKMVTLLGRLGLEKSDQGKFVLLRRNRGKLLKRPQSGGVEILASGRADWAGSLELIEEPVDEEAMRNTARVIRDVDADVVAVVEAEHRPGLCVFNETLLKAVGGVPYPSVMLIDGNDERGIDVGILARDGFTIERMKSHVDDRSAAGDHVFSRDCPEYWMRTATGTELIVLVNHFKSKGFGAPATSNARRKAQAARVAEIYDGLRGDGHDLIAVVGDFNDTPASDPLSPLIGQTDLADIFTHPNFANDGHPGTFGLANASNKIDYILLSPALFATVQAGGVFRKGAWPGVQPKRWEVYDEVARPEDAASDHAAVFADLSV
jgi:endonuclease/exonuclease/phosphatase family metal-dependent hydrolase